MLIEQQTVGPHGGTAYVPLEWTQSGFDAMKMLDGLGNVVVETGGNGGENLDDPSMLGRFDRGVRDSGAIVVGAGSSGTDHTPLSFSSWGSRVDLQGVGQNVTTTGFNGDLFGGTAPANLNVGAATPVTLAVDAPGVAGGTVPATLSLTLGAPASFGAFTPGLANDYTASTTATVTSTAGDATLGVSDPGHLVNGAFSLPAPLQVSGVPRTWSGPVSNDVLTLGFTQPIGAGDALRTGTYATTLTFTLSTTSP